MGPPDAAPGRRHVVVAGHRGDADVARRALDSPDAAARASALGALARLRQLPARALTAAFHDGDVVVRRRAATLAASRPDVDLLPALRDADATVVEVAAWAAGERAGVPDAVVARLVDLASAVGPGTDALVRESAVAALGAIGDDRGLDAILAATSDRPAIRRRAVLALAPFVAADHPRAADVRAALTGALTDRDWQVRQAAEDLTT